jgi:hypothetical protein
LAFKYYGGRLPSVNRDWLLLLEQSSNSKGGLQILDEPTSPASPRSGH